MSFKKDGLNVITSKERVNRALRFDYPDRVPQDVWMLPAAEVKYGEELQALLRDSNQDFFAQLCPVDVGYEDRIYMRGAYLDPWGCGWMNLQEGMAGQVKIPALQEWERLDKYIPPFTLLESYNWAQKSVNLRAQHDKFLLGGWINIFERMQFIRGPQDLYVDLGTQDKNLLILRDKLLEFYETYLEHWLALDIDGIRFGDDWGAQKSLLISPEQWRMIFKPAYSRLFRIVHDKGKHVFFHSDGYIFDIIDDFIELGVSAINCQLWCMGVERIGKRFAGRITFWGEISRQDILPFGNVNDILNAKQMMKRCLFIKGGGLIGQFEIGPDVPLTNIQACLREW